MTQPRLHENAVIEIDRVWIQGRKCNEPNHNRYLAVTQLWVKGERGFRRPDVLLYVNGLPLVFIELKNSNVKLKNAFDDNLTNYKREIPQLFLTNVFCVLSNAIETKVGSITSAQVRDIAQTKMPDLNATTIEAAEKIIAGTARSMGIKVEK